MARRRRARGGESKNAPRRPQAELVALHPSPWPPPPPLLYRPPGGPWLVATAQHGTAGLSFFFFFPGASGPAGPRRRRPILHWQGSSELQLTAAAEDRGGGRRDGGGVRGGRRRGLPHQAVREDHPRAGGRRRQGSLLAALLTPFPSSRSARSVSWPDRFLIWGVSLAGGRSLKQSMSSSCLVFSTSERPNES